MEKTVQLNRVELRGVVGNIRLNELNGKKVARITLATNYCYKASDGTPVIETTWHSISAWQSERVNCLDQIQKGTKLHIVGRLKNQRYITASGEERSATEIVAFAVAIIDDPLMLEE